MLVLVRKRNQSIRIGDAVLTVRHVGEGRVTLGIEAPRSVRIVRSELELVARAAAVGKLSQLRDAMDAAENQNGG